MDPIDAIEAHEAMRGLASLLRTFYHALMEGDDGFEHEDALDLTIECMHDMNMGASGD